MHYIIDLVFILSTNNDDSLQPMFEIINLSKLRVYSEVGAFFKMR
jgi:hypothetical protein